MSSFIDFESVKADHNILDVAGKLGLTLTQRGKQYRGPCPSGDGDERSLVITPDKGVWYSFAQEKGGDLISLVSFVKDTSAKEAARWIVDNLGGGNTTEEPTEKEPGAGLKELDYLQSDHPAVQALGFEVEDAKLFGIGFASKGTMRGLVAVPVRLEDGTLCGYVGISDARLPKSWKW